MQFLAPLIFLLHPLWPQCNWLQCPRHSQASAGTVTWSFQNSELNGGKRAWPESRMQIRQFPTMNVVIMYCKHVLIKTKGENEIKSKQTNSKGKNRRHLLSSPVSQFVTVCFICYLFSFLSGEKLNFKLVTSKKSSVFIKYLASGYPL